MAHFQVLFSGQIVEGAKEAQVRINLAHRFGLDQRKVNQLFSGRTVVIESGLGRSEAFALQKQLIDLGAVTRVKDLTPDEGREVKVDSRDYKSDFRRSDYTLKDITAAHIECPRCGHLQLDSQSCVRCGVDMTTASHQRRQQSRTNVQETRPAAPPASRPAPRPSARRTQRPQLRTEPRRRPRKGWLERLGFR